MSETFFTSGPWNCDKDNFDGDVYAGTHFVDAIRVAQGVRLEDKHLISAAPDLYESLDRLLEFVEEGTSLSYDAVIAEAKQALAKARGEL